MPFATRHRAAFPSQEELWKQPLLLSLIIHAALLWVATMWWQKSYREFKQPPQVIEVEVVKRAVPVPVAPLVARPEPVRPAPKVRPSAPPAQPQPKEMAVIPPRRQAPTQRQAPAASQADPVQAVPVSATGEMGQLDERPAAQDNMATKTTLEASPAVSLERTIDIEKAYQQQLKELIERHKQYPLIARKGRQQGRVVVVFSLHKTGEMGSVQVTQSSGHRLLDRAAIQAVRSVDKFPALPEGLPEDTKFRISINFSLE